MTATLLEEALRLWSQQPDCAPPLGRRYHASEQAVRESSLERFWQSVRAEMEHLPASRAERHAARERINRAFIDFARSGLGYSDAHLGVLLDGGLSRVGSDLARQARAFDASVSASAIFQATRNAWAACGLQALLGRPMRLTPAIFAYSMLYPYTDNYLDDPRVDRPAKQGFGQRFGQRLAGQPVTAMNRHEETIWQLVGLIESEYSRTAAPAVYASLLAIHQAQQASLRLLRNAVSEDEIARLSFAKGGCSVLADGYLAAGELSEAQQSFVYQWGVFLQLADDLQDITDDRRDGAVTLFTDAALRGPLDGVARRVLHFGAAAMGQMRASSAPGCETLLELIAGSSTALVVRAVGETAPLFSAACVDEFEAHSPFRYAFLRERRQQAGQRSHWLARLFEAFLAGDPDEPAFPLLPSSLMPRA